MCGNMFEAQKVSTLYCSHRCSSRHYKLKKKLELKKQAEAPIKNPELFRPKVKAMDIELIKEKEFLTVSELSVLFNCSRPTIYNLINRGKINANNIGYKKTLIRRSDIDKLFETPKQPKPEKLTTKDCYTMEQITDKFKVSRNTIYAYVSKHGIERIKENGTTYYSKFNIDNLFTV
jgi:excisionase family DNA binding protein